MSMFTLLFPKKPLHRCLPLFDFVEESNPTKSGAGAPLTYSGLSVDVLKYRPLLLFTLWKTKEISLITSKTASWEQFSKGNDEKYV